MYTLDELKIPAHLAGLLQFMKDNNKMAAIENYDKSLLHILSDDVLSKIRAGASSWEDDVPYEVVKAIKYFELFGFVKDKCKLLINK